jgi:putative FmdB family regulatory protein
MPTYPYKCSCCGHAEDRYCKIDERNDQACPECEQPLAIDFGQIMPAVHQKTYAGTQANGLPATLSLTEGFHPREVKAMREKMGSDGACINDMGEVHFKDTAARKSYFAKKRELRKSHQK